MKKFLQLVLYSLIIFICLPLTAQHAGNLHPDFNGTGIFTMDFYERTDVINDIAVQEDGKVVATGVAFTPNFNIDVKIIRVLENGELDIDFSDDGIVTVKPFISGYYETHASAILVKEDGKILVAGMVLNDDAIFDILLIQLNEDGSFDSDFGINGVSVVEITTRNDLALDLALSADGKILVAGQVENEMFNLVPTVMRFNPDGTLDETFGNNGLAQIEVSGNDNEFASICIQPDENILVAGHITNDWKFYALLCRFTSEGALDMTFGNNGIVTYSRNDIHDEFFALDLMENGEIICGGFTNTPSGNFDMLLVKYDTIGNLSSTFGVNGTITFNGGPYNVIYDLLVQSDDKILVTGSVGEFAPGNNDFALLRYKPNGGIDFFFGSDGVVLTDFYGQQDESNSLALSGNDKIYLGGKSLNPDFGVRDFTISCYYNDLTTLIFHTETAGNLLVYPNPAAAKTFLNNSKDAEIFIFDLKGNSVKSWMVDSDHFELNLSGIAAGVYMLKAISNNKISISKLIIR